MENSTDEQQRREEIYELIYCPCHFLENLIKSFLKCLGIENHQSEADEAAMNTNEEVDISARNLRRRRPRSPPVSSGGGGQINFAKEEAKDSSTL